MNNEHKKEDYHHLQEETSRQNTNGYFTPRQAQKLLGCSYSTLRRRAIDGRLQTITLPSGHRLYKLPDPYKGTKMVQNQKICYCRVSTKKQAKDLDNQVAVCRQKFPNHQIITDIGSALNWNRKGLKTILDRVLQGLVQEIVVTHKDRLSRFGQELLEYLFEKHQVKLLVLNQEVTNHVDEFSNDLLSVITVFTARHYGKRKYKSHEVKKDKIVLKLTPKRNLQSLDGDQSLPIQQNH